MLTSLKQPPIVTTEREDDLISYHLRQLHAQHREQVSRTAVLRQRAMARLRAAVQQRDAYVRTLRACDDADREFRKLHVSYENKLNNKEMLVMIDSCWFLLILVEWCFLKVFILHHFILSHRKIWARKERNKTFRLNQPFSILLFVVVKGFMLLFYLNSNFVFWKFEFLHPAPTPTFFRFHFLFWTDSTVFKPKTPCQPLTRNPRRYTIHPTTQFRTETKEKKEKEKKKEKKKKKC